MWEPGVTKLPTLAGSLSWIDMATMPAGTSMALVPVGVVPKRASWMYSPRWMSVIASRLLFVSLTLVSAPEGRPTCATCVFSMRPLRTASLRTVPAGTFSLATYTTTGVCASTARALAPRA